MTAEIGGQLETTPNSGAERNLGSAFEAENFRPVQLIMLMRLYDLGLAFLSAIDPKKAAEIVELHEQGHTFCPPPKFIAYEAVDEEVEV